MMEIFLSTADPRPIVPVILSGGSGTRLWPMSRQARPKQMLALAGERTMLQMTLDRVGDRGRFQSPIIVAAASQAEAIAGQIDGAAADARLILEPAARNTAPAIALAALASAPEDLLLVMPSDHLIADSPAFLDAVAAAAPLAGQDWLVTFGIRPTRAETGYGYIRRGAAIAQGVFKAERFVEKPDAATASAYLAEGCYDWNGGIFLLRAGAYLDALARHAPDILSAVRAAMPPTLPGMNPISPDAAMFEQTRPQSVDHAVMEHAGRVAVVPVDMGWSDIGSWQALYEVGAPDAAGNVVRGDAMLLDSSGCLVRSDGPMVVAIGVEDLTVVATGDVVLIVPRGQSQRVQEAVAALRERGDRRI